MRLPHRMLAEYGNVAVDCIPDLLSLTLPMDQCRDGPSKAFRLVDMAQPALPSSQETRSPGATLLSKDQRHITSQTKPL